MRTSIDIPDALMRRAKKVAIDRGTTLRALLLAGLRDQLEDGSDQPLSPSSSTAYQLSEPAALAYAPEMSAHSDTSSAGFTSPVAPVCPVTGAPLFAPPQDDAPLTTKRVKGYLAEFP